MSKDKYIDKSGDKSYFTIVPNYIINHSSAYEQALYLVMKRIAGETKTCWASPSTLAKKMGITVNTVKKYRDMIVGRGWVRKIGLKSVGQTNQKVNEYEIVDLWALNTKYYQKMSKNDSLKVSTGDGKVSTDDGKVSPVGHKEDKVNNNNKEDIVAEATQFILKEYLNKMSQDKNRHIQIIGLYFRFKGFNFENLAQIQAAIKRNVRPARELIGYSDDKISKVMKYLDNTMFDRNGNKIKWTVETINKYICEDLMRLRNPNL